MRGALTDHWARRFAAVLAAYHAAAGDLLPLCLQAELTPDEVQSAADRGDLTEESLRVLLALRGNDQAPGDARLGALLMIRNAKGSAVVPR